VTEERHSVPGTVFDDVFFTERSIEGAVRTTRIKVKMQGQNRNLDGVKRVMAKKAKKTGASTIANFRYGQKRGFFTWDDMHWFGEGDAIE
jgi:hypothetical protein